MAEVIGSAMGEVILAPAIRKSFEVILEKITNRKFNIDDYRINLFCTMFSKFKSNYTLDEVNNIIFESIVDYRTDDKECSYCIKDTVLSIIPHYTYANVSINGENLYENQYRTYPPEDHESIIVPGVTGVTLFVFFEQCSKESIKNAQILLDKINGTLLKKLNVKQHGKFLYFDTENETTKNKLIDKLSNEFKKHDETIKDRSGDENELKLRYSDLLLEMIAKVL